MNSREGLVLDDELTAQQEAAEKKAVAEIAEGETGDEGVEAELEGMEDQQPDQDLGERRKAGLEEGALEE